MRPWDKPGQRLSLKIFARNMVDAQQPDAGIGWSLAEAKLNPTQTGEVPVPPQIMGKIKMTPAEYKTAIESCGLSIQEAAAFHDVSRRKIDHWSQKGPVPEGVAGEIASLRAQLSESARQAVALWKRKGCGPVDLYRYRVNEYPETQQAEEGLPHGAHNRLLALTKDALEEEGAAVKLRYASELWAESGPAS